MAAPVPQKIVLVTDAMFGATLTMAGIDACVKSLEGFTHDEWLAFIAHAVATYGVGHVRAVAEGVLRPLSQARDPDAAYKVAQTDAQLNEQRLP